MPFLGTYKQKYSDINTVGKTDFIRLISAETGMSIKETRLFWNAVQVVVPRILEQGMELNLGRFGKFYTTDFSTASDITSSLEQSDKPKRLHKRKRVGFKPSRTFKRITG